MFYLGNITPELLFSKHFMDLTPDEEDLKYLKEHYHKGLNDELSQEQYTMSHIPPHITVKNKDVLDKIIAIFTKYASKSKWDARITYTLIKGELK